MQAWGPQLLSVPCLLIHTPTAPAGALGGPGSPGARRLCLPPVRWDPRGASLFLPPLHMKQASVVLAVSHTYEPQASLRTSTLSCSLPHPSHGDGQ